MALERQPELEHLVGRGVAAGDGEPGDEPGGDRRGGRAEPALERDPVDEAEAVAPRPARRARTPAARGARRVRGSSSAPSPSSATSGSPVRRRLDLELVPEVERRARRSRTPGPRFAVEAGATRRPPSCQRSPEPQSRSAMRSSSRSAQAAVRHCGRCAAYGHADLAGSLDVGRRVVAAVSTSTARVLQAVAGEHADDRAAGLELDVREARDAGGRRRLAEEAFEARDLEPRVRDLVVGRP